MDIPNSKKPRGTLKRYFVKNAIPSESQFAELIDGALNLADDGIYKTKGAPLSVEASDAGIALGLHKSFEDPAPSVSLTLTASDPNHADTKVAGLGIADTAGTTRFYYDPSAGRLGLGTVTPDATLHVYGDGAFEGGLDVRNDLTVGGNLKANGITLDEIDLGRSLAALNAKVTALEDAAVWIRSGCVGIENAPGFDSLRWEKNNSVRKATIHIKFSPPLSRAPEGIVAGISSIDAPNWHNDAIRIETQVMNESKTGFDIEVRTWSTSLIYDLKLNWIAYGRGLD